MSTVFTIILTFVILEILYYIRYEKLRKTIAISFSDKSSNRREFDDMVIEFYGDDTALIETIRDRMEKMVKKSLDSEDSLHNLGYSIIINNEQFGREYTMEEITEPKKNIVDER